MIVKKTIDLDMSRRLVNDTIRLHEGDVNGTALVLNVTDNGTPFDLTGCTAKFDAVIGNYLAEADGVATISDSTITVPITPQMTVINGLLKIDVKIIKGGSILFFQTLEMNVQRRVIQGDEQNDLDGTTIGQKLELLDELFKNPPEKRLEVYDNDLDHADKNDTVYIHKVHSGTGSYVKGIVFVAGDVPPYQGCTQYRLRKSGSVEYRFGALNLTTDPYSYDWGGYSATGDWKRLATLDDIPEAVNPWKNKRYLSHGDSITWYDGHGYLWGEHKGEIATGYQTIMKELLGLSYNRATDNKGRSGYTIAHNYEGSHDGSDNLVDVIADVNIDYTAYDLCTILGGTNDYRRATPLGELGQTGDDYESLNTDTFYGAYRKCVEYILTAAPDIRLVLITPFQRDPYPAWSSYEATYDGDKPNAEGLKLIDYVNAVKMVGKMYGLPVCDLYSNSGITELTLSTYTIDGLHPNDDGYKRMGEVLANTLTSGGNNDAALVIEGEKGDKGDKGDPGPAGADGYSPTATVVKSGTQSTITITDKNGTTTAVVSDGAKGDRGDTGAQGPKGDTGPIGPQGLKGDKGDTGDAGAKGDKGDTGATGPQGPKGDKGDKGDTPTAAEIRAAIDLSDYVKEEDVYTADEADDTFMKFAPEMNPINADRVHVGQLFKYSGLLYFKYGTGSNDYFEVSKKSDIPSVPTKTSELTNDSGFLTQHQDISGKVDKVEGKGLSTNDYTTAEKNKLGGIAAGANKTVIDTALSSTSTNPVQNKVIKKALDDLPSVPTKVSAFENDSGFLTLGTLPVYNGGVQ